MSSDYFSNENTQEEKNLGNMLTLNLELQQIFKDQIGKLDEIIDSLKTQKQTLKVGISRPKGNKGFEFRDCVKNYQNNDCKILNNFLGSISEARWKYNMKWDPNKDKLIKSYVLQQCLENFGEKIIENNNEIKSETDNSPNKQKKKKKKEKSSDEIQVLIDQQQENEIELFKNTSMVDWERVSDLLDPSADPLDCMFRWNNLLTPLVSKQEWKKTNLDQLYRICDEESGKKKKKKKKEEQELEQEKEKEQEQEKEKEKEKEKETETRERSVFQCFSEFMKKVNLQKTRVKWTEEETLKLRRIAGKFEEKDWHLISQEFDFRTANQCNKKYRELNKIKRNWTEHEDQILILGVKIYGEKWTKIAKHLNLRSGSQCGERYRLISSGQRSGRWLQEEESSLLQAVEKYGVGKWTLIAKEVGTRNDNQCIRKYQQLTKKKTKRKPKAKTKAKAKPKTKPKTKSAKKKRRKN
ncbi:snRNA-activating protein complex subunit 4 [Anaeramoeba flamelloides]|uniref:snRNA-activating protein complex subunit 4 n=1 Tax=Anaeramoeba flamelloides TaxID=1746091 RepID=A0ABQ8XA07_9EUKA|nr:snRNA-activating protein complex subunit 4 [Anaeramoeba flamelloides]